jgi:hypothetical protein
MRLQARISFKENKDLRQGPELAAGEHSLCQTQMQNKSGCLIAPFFFLPNPLL